MSPLKSGLAMRRATLSLVLFLMLLACGQSGETGASATRTAEGESAERPGEPAAGQELAVLQDQPERSELWFPIDERTRGPNGETPTPFTEVALSSDDVERVRSGDYTAAILWHGPGVLFDAITEGLTTGLTELNIEVLTKGDANFDPARQQEQVETVLAQNPDLLFTFVLDTTTGAQVFGPAVEQGTKLVFVSSVPDGFVHGDDYVAMATGDLAGLGVAAAELMGNALGEEGKVGFIFHDAGFWVTEQRDGFFREALEDEFPDIEIVAESGITDPAKGEEVANAMLTRHPDIQGIYAPWAEPAQGVLAALRTAGRDGVKVVTHDLDPVIVLDLLEGGSVVGTTEGAAFDIGLTLAKLGAYGVLERPAPPLVIAPGMKVTPENATEVWRAAYAVEPPDEIIEASSQ